jgi:hypothetical protein
MAEDNFRVNDDYERARRRALFRDVLARLSGRPNRLLSFDEVKQSLQLGGPIYRGVQSVPIAQIIGSVERYRDFDREFLPAQARTADRWKSIARAFYDDVDLPPVRLYKVGDAYFVLDGHHRVSVAREQGQEFIDAEVQEAYSRVPVTADLEAKDLKVLHEYRRFLERTRLDEIRPEQRIRFTIAGGYDRLIEHIAVHRTYMELEQHRSVSEEEAVGHWYDTVYRPIVEAIRAHDVLADFPNRTESDLYLWIVEHLYYLRQEERETSIDEAAEDYVDQFSERPLRKFARGFKQAFTEGSSQAEAQLEDSRAHQEFVEHTRINQVRPQQNIRCTLIDGYDRLIEHISQHRYFMGQDLKRGVSLEEAVGDWYDKMYLPVVRKIRRRRVLDQFLGRTEADLYVLVADYLDRVRERRDELPIEQVAAHYAEELGRHPTKKIVRALQEMLNTPDDPEPADVSN